MPATTPQSHVRHPVALIAAAGATILAWGMTFTGMRICLRTFHGPEFALARYLTACAILLAMSLWMRPALPRAREWPMLLVLSVIGIGLYNIMFSCGISHMHAGPGSFINNSSSLFASLFAVLMLGERPSPVIWLGIAVSIGGICMIAIGESGGASMSPAALLLFGSAICYALYLVLQKSLLEARGAFWVVAWSMWIGTAMLLPWTPGLIVEAAHAPASTLVVLLLIGLVPTVGGWLLWSWCLRQAPVSVLAPALYLVPVVSVVTAWLVLGEHLSTASAAGCVVIIAGVIIGGRGRVRAKAAPASVAPEASPIAVPRG